MSQQQTCGSKAGKEVRNFFLFRFIKSSVASATTGSANSLQQKQRKRKHNEVKI